MNKEILIVEAYRLGFIAGAQSVYEDKENVNDSLEMVVALLKDLDEREEKYE